MHKMFFLFFLTLFSQLSLTSAPYLWETNTSGTVLANMKLKDTNGTPLQAGSTSSVALSSSGKAYIVGTGDAKPYLWVSDASGSIETSVDLNANQGSATSVALSSSGKAYIVGTGDAKSYLWVSDASGSIETSVELKNANGDSFTQSSLALSVALSSSGKAYIVGTGDTKPYLWVASSSGSIETSVELKNANGDSFTQPSLALSVALSSSGKAYIVGEGGQKPYLWVSDASGSIETSVDLNANQGSATSVALSSSGKAYIVGQGDQKPYLWVASSSGSIDTSIELLSNTGDSFTTGSPTSLAISASGVIYMIGTGIFNNISIPYLWIANDSNSAISSIELKDSNNHSFIQGASPIQVTTLASKAYIVGYSTIGAPNNTPNLPYLWIVNTPSFISNIELKNSQGSSFVGGTLSDIGINNFPSQSELLVSALQYSTITPLKGIQKAASNPVIIYITGSF